MIRSTVIGAAALAGFAAGPALADEYVVELIGAEFVYNGQSNDDIDLKIRPGDSVRWVWVSGMHNVVSGTDGSGDEGDEFDSGDAVLPPHEFVHVFDEAGEFPYFCELHVFIGMKSSVTVLCAGDYNGDGTVNTLDVLSFLNDWSAGDPDADFNGDGSINTLDVLSFLNAWSAAC